MKVAHVLRKYDPAQWGGTESAVRQLADGLACHNFSSVFFAPRLASPHPSDPLLEAGHEVKRYKAFVPVARISHEQRKQLVCIGGNLMSFNLLWKLWREPKIDIIHAHTVNRIGGIALTVARLRRVPTVATIHGGFLDLPQSVRETLAKPLAGGVEWGKIFGPPLRSRHVLRDVDAIVTCNAREAEMLREKYPNKRVLVQPHGVTTDQYREDHRPAANRAYPPIAGKQVVLVVGRIDPVKNQGFLIEHASEIVRRHPTSLIVFAGACTDEAYGKALKKEIRRSGLDQYVYFTGGIPPGDVRLIGLLQSARVVLVPSVSETFGLVILEAWAAKAPVISTRTSGALSLIKPDQSGWFFDLTEPLQFLVALDEALNQPSKARRFAEAGYNIAARDFDTAVLAKRVHNLYNELIQEVA